MSLPKPDLHVRISEGSFEKLAIIAEYHDKSPAQMSAILLEKMIAGEYHYLQPILDKMEQVSRSRKR